MRQGKIVLAIFRSGNNRDDKITKRAIVVSNMQMSSIKCITMKFLVVANVVNFLNYCRNKKNGKKENGYIRFQPVRHRANVIKQFNFLKF